MAAALVPKTIAATRPTVVSTSKLNRTASGSARKNAMRWETPLKRGRTTLAAATVTEARTTRRHLFDEDHVLGFPPVVGDDDIEAHDGLRAPSFRPLPFGKSGSKDGETLTLLRLNEAEILDLVEPEHRSSHPLPFAGSLALPTTAERVDGGFRAGQVRAL